MSTNLTATIVTDTLYFNRGGFPAVDSTTFPACAWNSSTLYSPLNQPFQLFPGDQLALTVINTDTAAHSFVIKGLAIPSLLIAALGTANDTFSFATAGIYIYYDSLDASLYSYLGAAGMIAIEPKQPDGRFFWNFHEFSKQWNIAADSGITPGWNNFDPDYFTVNGSSYPFIDDDSTAKVTGATGDTIFIHCANTGLSVHSVHFHGYHCRVVFSSKDSIQVNWYKDSFPLWPGETAILEIVPDKPGLFPVHDHNLMAQTGNRYYNHGMMLIMKIQ